MKNVITIAIALTTLAAGWLLGKHFGDVQYIEKPVEIVKLEYVDTCLTMVKVNGKIQGIKKGVQKIIAEDIPTPSIVEGTFGTIDSLSVQGEYNTPAKLFKFEHKDSLLHIQEYVIVRGEIVAFERKVTLDTPLVAAYPIKPSILNDVVDTAIKTFTNPSFNPNLGKGTELGIILGGMYNFKPEVDAMGGYTIGANMRFEGGSSIGLTYNNIAKTNYAGFHLTLPVLKFNRN